MTLFETLVFSRVHASLAEELRILARGVDDTVAERRGPGHGRRNRRRHGNDTVPANEGAEAGLEAGKDLDA